MALTLAIASLLVQALSFVGISFLIADLLVLPGVFYPDGNWTIAGLLPYALETVVGYWLAFLLGAIGATVAAVLMIRSRFRATWFLNLCRIVAWLWMPLLPIGPVFGAILLRARVTALRGARV